MPVLSGKDGLAPDSPSLSGTEQVRTGACQRKQGSAVNSFSAGSTLAFDPSPRVKQQRKRGCLRKLGRLLISLQGRSLALNTRVAVRTSAGWLLSLACFN